MNTPAKTTLELLKKKSVHNLLCEYESLRNDENKRLFLNKLTATEQKNLLKLYSLKNKNSAPLRAARQSLAVKELTKAVLTGTKLQAVDSLYEEKGVYYLKAKFSVVISAILDLYGKFFAKFTFNRPVKTLPASALLLVNLKNKHQTVQKTNQLILASTKTSTKGYSKRSRSIAGLFWKTTFVGTLMGVVMIVFGAQITNMVDPWLIQGQKYIYAASSQNYSDWSTVFLEDSDSNPTEDEDRDGLTNYEEFLLRTDPRNADQNNNNVLDGADVLANIDPGDSGAISSVEISKNLTSYRLQKVALQNVNDANSKEVLGVNSFQAQVDIVSTGSISIPSINFSGVPITWNVSGEESSLRDTMLTSLVHNTESRLPGEAGKTHIYAFNSKIEQTVYNQSFDQIVQLKPLDEIFIQAKATDGSLWEWKYLVVSQNLFIPGDKNQFEQDDLSELQLVVPDAQSQGAKVICFNARFIEQKRALESDETEQKTPDTEDANTSTSSATNQAEQQLQVDIGMSDTATEKYISDIWRGGILGI